MEKLANLIRLIAGGADLDDAWKASGFDSLDEARRALRSAADSISTLAPPLPFDAEAEAGAPGRSPGPAGHIVIYTDGASRGNPGPSAVAAVACTPAGEKLTAVSHRIGDATNNVAEYRAVLEGLRLARMLHGKRVTVRLDSELVARQLNGQYRVKSAALRPLAEAVLAEAVHFTRCVFEHVPRSENREADRLANGALDEAVDPEHGGC